MNSTERFGLLLARGWAAIWLDQMRLIEQKTADPERRWTILRQSLDVFAHDQSRPVEGNTP